MTDHQELISEMPLVQQMTVEQRLQHARNRRIQQLDFWKKQISSYSVRSKRNSIKRSLKYPDEVLLLDATQRNDLDEVENLLKRGVLPDLTNHDGFTALHQSSIDGSKKILDLLISYGGNVNCIDEDGWTPLHAAVACRRISVIQTLLDNGADPLALNNEMTFPHDMTEDPDILEVLEKEFQKRGILRNMLEELRRTPELRYKKFLENGGLNDSAVILQTIDGSNTTHLHFAAAYNFCDVARYLLFLGAAVDCLDNRLWTPLHVGCHFSQQLVVQVLLENEADPTLITENGLNAFDLCSDPEMKQWMVNFIAVLSQSDPLQRRSTLPAQCTLSPMDIRRNSLRRSSLRECRPTRRHDDSYLLVLSSKDTDQTTAYPSNPAIQNRPAESRTEISQFAEDVPVATRNYTKLENTQGVNQTRNRRNKWFPCCTIL